MDSLPLPTANKAIALIGTSTFLAIIDVLSNIVYKLHFHPLAKISGPKLNALARIQYVRHLLAGTTVTDVS
ncbi:hypothetical protein LTR49_027700 [Elasticomyces elasticus]|nr:hypothetical protein LTR49_027700 [Elasticomyces elasticus]